MFYTRVVNNIKAKIMKRKLFVIFLFVLLSSLIYGQSNRSLHTSVEGLMHKTEKPSVQDSAENAEIISVIIFKHFMLVRIKFISRGKSGNFTVPSNAYISDYNNSKNIYRIREFEDFELDKQYDIGRKRTESEFNLIFHRIAPGIELINIDIPSENGSLAYRWKRVGIKNPDDHPKTNWSEYKLKAHWLKNGADQFEGIYENTANMGKSPKYKLSLKKEANGYNLIYESGAAHLTWRTGDIKAFLTETATPNLFKAVWYMSNKTPNENLYISFEAGIMKILWSNLDGTKTTQDFLKLYSPVKRILSKTSLSSGTGFALSSDGYIVTNQHIIDKAKVIRIRGLNGDFTTRYKAKVIAEDKNNDLAILKIDDISFGSLAMTPYTFRKSNSSLGEEVYCLGYPVGALTGDEVKLSYGIISSRVGFQGDITNNQINVSVLAGNSGGPLLNSKGEIIGIINTKYSGSEKVSYAIKTSYLMNLMQIVESEINLPSLNTLGSKDLFSQVQFVKKFVYIVESE